MKVGLNKNLKSSTSEYLAVTHMHTFQKTKGANSTAKAESVFLLDILGYRLYDPEQRKIILSRDVKFIEEGHQFLMTKEISM